MKRKETRAENNQLFLRTSGPFNSSCLISASSFSGDQRTKAEEEKEKEGQRQEETPLSSSALPCSAFSPFCRGERQERQEKQEQKGLPKGVVEIARELLPHSSYRDLEQQQEEEKEKDKKKKTCMEEEEENEVGESRASSLSCLSLSTTHEKEEKCLGMYCHTVERSKEDDSLSFFVSPPPGMLSSPLQETKDFSSSSSFSPLLSPDLKGSLICDGSRRKQTRKLFSFFSSSLSSSGVCTVNGVLEEDAGRARGGSGEQEAQRGEQGGRHERQRGEEEEARMNACSLFQDSSFPSMLFLRSSKRKNGEREDSIKEMERAGEEGRDNSSDLFPPLFPFPFSSFKLRNSSEEDAENVKGGQEEGRGELAAGDTEKDKEEDTDHLHLSSSSLSSSSSCSPPLNIRTPILSQPQRDALPVPPSSLSLYSFLHTQQKSEMTSIEGDSRYVNPPQMANTSCSSSPLPSSSSTVQVTPSLGEKNGVYHSYSSFYDSGQEEEEHSHVSLAGRPQLLSSSASLFSLLPPSSPCVGSRGRGGGGKERRDRYQESLDTQGSHARTLYRDDDRMQLRRRIATYHEENTTIDGRFSSKDDVYRGRTEAEVDAEGIEEGKEDSRKKPESCFSRAGVLNSRCEKEDEEEEKKKRKKKDDMPVEEEEGKQKSHEENANLLFVRHKTAKVSFSPDLVFESESVLERGDHQQDRKTDKEEEEEEEEFDVLKMKKILIKRKKKKTFSTGESLPTTAYEEMATTSCCFCECHESADTEEDEKREEVAAREEEGEGGVVSHRCLSEKERRASVSKEGDRSTTTTTTTTTIEGGREQGASQVGVRGVILAERSVDTASRLSIDEEEEAEEGIRGEEQGKKKNTTTSTVKEGEREKHVIKIINRKKRSYGATDSSGHSDRRSSSSCYGIPQREAKEGRRKIEKILRRGERGAMKMMTGGGGCGDVANKEGSSAPAKEEEEEEEREKEEEEQQDQESKTGRRGERREKETEGMLRKKRGGGEDEEIEEIVTRAPKKEQEGEKLQILDKKLVIKNRVERRGDGGEDGEEKKMAQGGKKEKEEKNASKKEEDPPHLHLSKERTFSMLARRQNKRGLIGGGGRIGETISEKEETEEDRKGERKEARKVGCHGRHVRNVCGDPVSSSFSSSSSSAPCPWNEEETIGAVKRALGGYIHQVRRSKTRREKIQTVRHHRRHVYSVERTALRAYKLHTSMETPILYLHENIYLSSTSLSTHVRLCM
ncbi:hypothetical protein CSUI_003003 [Cystoisospora suis]|uniref:Uncharacterized protein n=1 Tax=Cystoisospora suis TaxID=483139 RepID=A0A2C6KRX9_9APIC|nr:hypothetical protein CSUI_003003 [Cystoisospora suis]